ncbi:MAG: heavy-metal-associated domain-containing protein [Rhodobacteraceae bacterium]|nr:heavy-metal-associated domain-containing protein [Paracoccaceae bacterium]
MKFKVPDMSCGHCTAAIEKAIGSADPAALVACNLTDRTVDIESSLSSDTLVLAIAEAGYSAEISTKP